MTQSPLASPTLGEWEALCNRLRVLTLALFGEEPDALTFHFRHQGKAKVPLAPRRPPTIYTETPPSVPAVPAATAAAAAPAEPWPTEPWHSDDYGLVRWPGLGAFRLTVMQAKAVRYLWLAWERGTPTCDQDAVLRAIGSDSARLADLFRRSEAYGSLLVVVGQSRYRLPEWPPVAEPTAETGGEG